jgi:glycosyltransferase involved in cell wall biosynthesis
MIAQKRDFQPVLLVRSKSEQWIPPGTEVVAADIAHYSLQEQAALPRIIAGAKADLLFSPHFNVPLSCPLPFLVTIHDLILHRYPNQASLPKRLAYRLLIKRSVRRAQSIIAVSKFVKDELLSEYGSDIAQRIAVIPEGVSARYRPQSAEKIQEIKDAYRLHHPFLLYVGNNKQHKNVRTLIDAFAASGLGETELIVVCDDSALEKTLPSRVRMLSNVADADLPALYSAASAFVTASLYEGYCLPIAEALACGCPVIASNLSAIPETAHGKALLVDPTIDGFRRAFRSIPSRGEPFIVGTWEETAKRTIDILQKNLTRE